MNRLIYNGKTYDDENDGGDKLMSANCYIGDSLTADELPVDTLTAVVRDYDLETSLLAAHGTLVAAGGMLMVAKRSRYGLLRYDYGAEILYYHGDDLIGKFYLQTIKRTGKNEYQFNCISGVGLLLTDYYYGGVYDGQSMAEVVADIIRGIVPYTLDAELGATPLYGWLPKATRRDNLRDVLFAVGGQIRKDTAGQINIIPMSAGTPYEITPDEMYIGGSVTGGNPASSVQITEHAYIALPTDEAITLFDGEVAAETIVTPNGRTVVGVLVEFGEPVHDLTATNTTILESGANYAVLSQSPAATLVGLRYTHTERIISRRGSTAASPNVVTSSACKLVNLLNAENVADRVMAYYGAAKSIEADLVVTSQKPGDAVSFTDPFGDATQGYIQSLDITMSNILKARATLIAGYIPTASGNYYQHVAIITTDQTFIVPAECRGKIRAVLIGGGDGGSIGSPGTDGGAATKTSYGKSGEGGEPGAPGSGGKVFVITAKASSGDTFAAHIGAGGVGETADSTAQSGGDTTLGPYSSADGYPAESGYAALIGGGVYATNGPDGLPGGKGNQWDEGVGYTDGPTITYQGVDYTPGANGENGSRGSYYGWGGLGGGAAAGANGGDGERGYVDSQSFADGGDGGRGATPVKAQNGSIPGQGGGGGHGGGGGGGGGPAKGPGSSSEWYGQGGPGGSGGEGGDGAAGIILIYY